MIIAGIDPGYDRLGVAILNHQPKQRKNTLEVMTCIQTNKNDDLMSRYQTITEGLSEIFETWEPNEVAIEALFFSKNTTTALRVAEVKGICIAAGIQRDANIFEYTPPQIKVAITGNGKATKNAVAKMLAMQVTYPQNASKVDDAIDAAATAVTHAVSRQRNQNPILNYT